jgi:serine/alanine adding enzyme
MENYKDSAVLFFCYIDIDKYLKFLKEDIKENPDKKEFNEKQIEEAKKVKEEYGVRPLVGSTIVIMPTCNKGVKTAKFLYAGYNTDILPSLKITNGLMFYRLSYALDNGCDYCDLGGMDGNLSDHLSTFKSKFNPEVLELVGEYDLVISKFWFGLFNLAMKTLKFIRSKR